MRPFAITTVSDRVNLDAATRRGSASVTVTNSTDKPLRAWPDLKELGSTKKDWLTLEGGGEKSFSPKEAQTFKATVNVSKDAAAGRYEFKFNMISGTKGAEEESTEGPVLGFEVQPSKPPPPPPPIWLFIVIGVIVLGGIVGLVLFLHTPKVEVPDLHGKTLSDAASTLNGLKLTNSVEHQHTGTNPVDRVFAQNPKANEQVKVGSEITLYIESASTTPPPPPTTKVPNFKNLTVQSAVTSATQAKVFLKPTYKVVADPKLLNIIIDQSPLPGTSVAQASEVTVIVGNHVPLIDTNLTRIFSEQHDAVRRILINH